MNTPAHLLIGAAVMGRKGAVRIILAAMLGALLPDLSLYLMAGVSLFVLNIPPQIVFDQLYFSDTWQTVFAIDNSVFVWGTLLGLAIWRRSDWGIALCGAALVHIGLDFPLHHDDGRAHFRPLTGWVFESPVSYWDRDQGAGWVAPLEAALAMAAAVILWRAYPRWWMGLTTLCLLGMELWVVRQWLFFFTDST